MGFEIFAISSPKAIKVTTLIDFRRIFGERVHRKGGLGGGIINPPHAGLNKGRQGGIINRSKGRRTSLCPNVCFQVT